MNRVAIVAVFAAFLIPVVLATLMHSQWLDWQLGSGRNHGELIEPVIELENFQVTDAQNQSVSLATLRDRWQLIHIANENCGDRCLENLYWLRQVRLAQDRHQPDIGLIFVSGQEQSVEALQAIYELAPDFIVLHGDSANAFLTQLPESDRQGGFYIGDPLNNIILRYPMDADHNGIRRDLRRLVTWTQRD